MNERTFLLPEALRNATLQLMATITGSPVSFGQIVQIANALEALAVAPQPEQDHDQSHLDTHQSE